MGLGAHRAARRSTFRAATAEALYASVPSGAPDVVYIDAEGHDAAIIASLFAAAAAGRVRLPALLRFEGIEYVRGDRGTVRSLSRALAERGYTVLDDGGGWQEPGVTNVVAWRPAEVAAAAALAGAAAPSNCRCSRGRRLRCAPAGRRGAAPARRLSPFAGALRCGEGDAAADTNRTFTRCAAG